MLEKDELAVSLSQPQPAALLDFGGVRLGSGHVMFGSLEDRMRSHLVQLQHRDLRCGIVAIVQGMADKFAD